MKQDIILSIRGSQRYQDQEPDVIELVTEGTMEFTDGGWNIRYQESELTGLAGVTTTFRVERDKVVLARTGALNSEMVFQEGIAHESLYRMEFGALMITVCAKRIWAQLDETGGIVDLIYAIEIENSAAGEIDYHLTISPK